MIISASRRTDIPAFYAEWMIRRIREGFCTVPNPLNRNQVSRISLRPEDVDAIVFWTRNPRPLMPHLAELDSRGFRYYFQYTILGYPREIDPKSPAAPVAVQTCQDLCQIVGPGRIVWRYDPIVFSELTLPSFHSENFQQLAAALRGQTSRVVVSVVDTYRKTEQRWKKLEGTPAAARKCDPEEFAQLMRDIVKSAEANDLDIVSCAEPIELRSFGIRPGKCVDDELLKEVFGIQVTTQKDPTQRDACGCVASRDIGMYNSCVFGCQYCYATRSFEQAQIHLAEHDPCSPSLLETSNRGPNS
jgi:hypothetical protein